MTPTLFVTENGRFRPGEQAGVDAMLARLAAVENPRLLLFVHGGLVNQTDGINGANHFAWLIHELSGEGWEIAAPIWRSGVGEAVESNWEELKKEPRFVRIALRIAAWLDRRFGNKLFAEAMIATPPPGGGLEMLQQVELPEAEQVHAELAAQPEMLDQVLMVEDLTDQHLADAELAQDILADEELVGWLEADLPHVDQRIVRRVEATRRVPLTGSDKRALATPAAWIIAIAVARIGWRVLKRKINRRDHGLGPTIVEELLRALYLAKAGAELWGSMKGDARQHFDAGGAGTYLIERLGEMARGGKDVRVLAIGHSAGALFCGRLARATRLAPPNLSVGHILLAPAIRIDEAAENYAAGRFEGLRIFTMNDPREIANALDGKTFGKAYSRSLLYLISGALEDKGDYPDAPLLGMQRHLAPPYKGTRRENAARERLEAVLAGLPDPVIFAPSPDNAAPGHRTNSFMHGGFWEDSLTYESIKEIARLGFKA